MPRQNCWEYRACGREPGGGEAQRLGVCPAATAQSLEGVNHGVNGGRACWVASEGQCTDRLSRKFTECRQCDFFLLVEEEEGSSFKVMRELLERIPRPGKR